MAQSEANGVTLECVDIVFHGLSGIPHRLLPSHHFSATIFCCKKPGLVNAAAE